MKHCDSYKFKWEKSYQFVSGVRACHPSLGFHSTSSENSQLCQLPPDITFTISGQNKSCVEQPSPELTFHLRLQLSIFAFKKNITNELKLYTSSLPAISVLGSKQFHSERISDMSSIVFILNWSKGQSGSN